MPLKLADLEPQWIALIEGGRRLVDTMAQAQGIQFLCPKYFATNNGRIGTHLVICWSRSRGVPDDVVPGPGRWKLEGTGFHDLTLAADPPAKKRSVKLLGGCCWHDHVTCGEIRK